MYGVNMAIFKPGDGFGLDLRRNSMVFSPLTSVASYSTLGGSDHLPAPFFGEEEGGGLLSALYRRAREMDCLTEQLGVNAHHVG